MIKDGKFYKKKEGMKRMSKKILVTGCNGQLGRAINKEYAGSDVTFINTDVVAVSYTHLTLPTIA